MWDLGAWVFFFQFTPSRPALFWAWCVVLLNGSRIGSDTKKKYGPNSTLKASSKGEGCPHLIYYILTLSLVNVGLGGLGFFFSSNSFMLFKEHPTNKARERER